MWSDRVKFYLKGSIIWWLVARWRAGELALRVDLNRDLSALSLSLSHRIESVLLVYFSLFYEGKIDIIFNFVYIKLYPIVRNLQV